MSVSLTVRWMSVGSMVSVGCMVPWRRGRLRFDPHRVHRDNGRLLTLVHTQARTHGEGGDLPTQTWWLRREGSWLLLMWPACCVVTAQSPSWSTAVSVFETLHIASLTHCSWANFTAHMNSMYMCTNSAKYDLYGTSWLSSNYLIIVFVAKLKNNPQKVLKRITL